MHLATTKQAYNLILYSTDRRKQEILRAADLLNPITGRANRVASHAVLRFIYRDHARALHIEYSIP